MLESIVSVLPSDWFLLSLIIDYQWPQFQETHCKYMGEGGGEQ